MWRFLKLKLTESPMTRPPPAIIISFDSQLGVYSLHTGTVCTSFGGCGSNACLLFAARLSLFGLQNCYISFCILQSHCYLFKIVSVLLFCQKLSLCWYFVQNCPCFCCKNHNSRALSDLRCFCCNLYLAKLFCHFQPAVKSVCFLCLDSILSLFLK